MARTLVQQGAEIDFREELSDQTLLQIASRLGHIDIVQLLLETGVDANAKAGHFGTALMNAIREGQGKIVKIPVDHGADMNAGDILYGTLLRAARHWAVPDGKGGAILSDVIDNSRLTYDKNLTPEFRKV